MRWRVLFWSVWLLLAFAFSVRFIFADGEPCYDCQNCYNGIIECAQNGGCSSNCVKFSPSDCSNFVSGVLSELATISNAVVDIDTYIDSYFSSLENNVYPAISNAADSVRVAMSVLDNYSSSNSAALSSAVSLLSDSRSRCITTSNYWDSVDSPVNSGLFVSNRLTGVTKYIIGNSASRVTRTMGYVVPRLDSAISILSDLHDYSINEISTARSDLEVVLTFLDDVEYNIRMTSVNIDYIMSLLPTIRTSSANIERSVSSVNCEPCGRGGDGSGGSGGTVDFTGVSAQLEDIRLLLQQIYSLIYNYYTDYDAARVSRPSGEPSYQAYASLDDNWFKRVEYLLYSSSSVASNNLEGTESPDTIEGQTAFESETSELEGAVDTITGGFDQSLSRPWSKFSEHFSQFWDRLNAFKLPGQSSGTLGQLEWSHLEILKYSKDGNGFTLQAESGLDGFPSVWYKFAVGFRVLWFLLVLTLYCLFFVFMVKYSFKVAAFVTKLLNTSFGSG